MAEPKFLDTTNKSAARAAIGALSSEDVADEIAEAVSSVELVSDAVEVAVTADIAGRHLVEDGDQRVPRFGDRNSLKARSRSGEVVFDASVDGVFISNLVEGSAGAVLPSDFRLALTDDGALQLYVKNEPAGDPIPIGAAAPASPVMLTVAGAATIAPKVALKSGSTATAHWQWAGGSATGLNPTIVTTGAATIEMTVLDGSTNAIADVETFNLGYDNTIDTGTYSPGSGYNQTAQTAVTSVSQAARMTGLIRFLAAGCTSLAGLIDFSGMSHLLNIELAGSKVSSVNLTGCTALQRINVNGNDLGSLNVNPAAGQIREVRASWQRKAKLTVSAFSPMANLAYLDLRGCNLNFTQVDALLASVNGWATSNGTVDVRQNVGYSAAALSAVAGLMGRGWTLQSDGTVVAASPTIIGSQIEGNSSGNTMIFEKSNLPTLADGDYLVACLRNSASTGVTDFACSGFTRLGAPFGVVDSTSRVVGTYGHVVSNAASEPSTWTFTLTGTGSRNAGVMMLVRGVNITDPIAGFEGRPSADDFASQTGALVIAAAAAEVTTGNSATASAVDADYTTVNAAQSTAGTSGSRSAIWVGQKTLTTDVAPSAQGTTWVSPAGLTYWSISLRGIPVAFEDGFDSVDDFLAVDGATSAHRGASQTPGKPEMSSCGYDFAALRGYGLLEFSANRTSDGVWVGCHDATLNRTSETTGLTIADMTWAQVQQHLNTYNDGDVPRPYTRLDEFLDRWTTTHTVMVDPKSGASAYMDDFLNVLDAHGGPEKILVKFGAGGYTASKRAETAATRGYTTWGYFYEEHYLDGTLDVYQDSFTTLGMDYTASTDAWTAVLSYGKRVMAHLITSQAGYTTAMGKGALMAQCARPDLVTPVSVP